MGDFSYLVRIPELSNQTTHACVIIDKLHIIDLPTILYGFKLPFNVAFRSVAAEVCEELFTPQPPHAELALNGVEVFMNASGSHHQLRRLDPCLRAQ